MRNRTTVFIAILAIGAAAATLTHSDESAQPPASAKVSSAASANSPVKFNEAGELIRPEGYRTWVFVGSSLGLSYNEPRAQQTDAQAQQNPGVFHNVYIEPSAYREYMATGKFPDKTILAMDNFRPGSKISPAKGGFFEGDFAGMEVALKDKEHLTDGWGYFNFTAAGGQLKPSAKAFPKASCFDCHSQHAADDNVFTQFYPVLRRAEAESAAK